jgi:hypothetical protein
MTEEFNYSKMNKWTFEVGEAFTSLIAVHSSVWNLDPCLSCRSLAVLIYFFFCLINIIWVQCLIHLTTCPVFSIQRFDYTVINLGSRNDNQLWKVGWCQDPGHRPKLVVNSFERFILPRYQAEDIMSNIFWSLCFLFFYCLSPFFYFNFLSSFLLFHPCFVSVFDSCGFHL